jgi:hypothetical protein
MTQMIQKQLNASKSGRLLKKTLEREMINKISTSKVIKICIRPKIKCRKNSLKVKATTPKKRKKKKLPMKVMS